MTETTQAVDLSQSEVKRLLHMMIKDNCNASAFQQVSTSRGDMQFIADEDKRITAIAVESNLEQYTDQLYCSAGRGVYRFIDGQCLTGEQSPSAKAIVCEACQAVIFCIFTENSEVISRELRQQKARDIKCVCGVADTCWFGTLLEAESNSGVVLDCHCASCA